MKRSDGVRQIGARLFDICPLWFYSEESDLYFPVMEADQLPESERDLSISATFSFPNGLQLRGYIVGVSNIFSVGLFCGDKTFHLNKNLKDLSAKQLNGLFSCMGPTQLRPERLMPLSFRTRINRAGFREVEGEFDLFARGY